MPVALRRGRNSLIVRKRHERVNLGKAQRGKTHKWGFSLFLANSDLFTKHLLLHIIPRFNRFYKGEKELKG